MSSTKTRGRVTQIIEATSTSPLISNIATAINPTNALQQQYVPSLLKIESVVPTRLNASSRNLQQRANRLMTRSYSTLCGPATSIANGSTTSIATTTSSVVNYKNVSKRINSNFIQQVTPQFRHHHRYKNHHANNSNNNNNNDTSDSPTGKINNQQANELTSIAIENGVHKVRRTYKEKEKQPDRINLDRRGLCTIPIIDNEPNLRLLSLQHNLINAFHIPDCEVTVELSDGAKDNNNNNTVMPSKDVDLNNGVISANGKSSTPSKTATLGLSKQKSRNQLNLNFSANINNNNNLNTNNNNGTNAMTNGVGVGNGSVKAANGTITPTSFLQKSFMFQAKSGLLKRANSVMINYSPAQTPTGANSTIFGSLQRAKLVATPSFSVIDMSTNHHEISNGMTIVKAEQQLQPTPQLQIDANNSYMNSFRFNLTNLVFLDLYNNQIEKISNLDGLKSLTVLLLGKNRISDITGIISLKHTLRVLDLHGNRITHITQKICQLQELKSLNLAGNLLRQIQPNDFAGLCCLKELNLKRNRIKKINVSDDLHNLERLWLCHNELSCIDDMSSIAKSINLKEITIENNPISLAGDCVSFLVSYLPMLLSLNQLQITEQVRRAANAWRRSKENTDQNFQHLSTDVSSSIRREEIISNARTNWELIRSQQANIINGNQRQVNQIKKSIKSKLTSINSSSSTSTTSIDNNNNGNGTSNVNSSKKKNLIDAPTVVNKRQKSKLLRSTSHENTSSIISDSDCHLPPMIDQIDDDGEEEKLMLKKKRSASSTRPNVDSESDFIASDEDDVKSFKSQVPTTPPINPPSTSSQTVSPVEIIIKDNEGDEREKSPPLLLPPIEQQQQQQPPPPIVASPLLDELKEVQNNESLSRTPTPTKEKVLEILSPTINIEETPIRMKTAPQIELKMETIGDGDKLSIVSKTSTIKTSTESNVTSSSPTNDDHHRSQVHASHTAHTRNRSGVTSRKIGPPLVRSHTVRNLSSHLHNQIAAGLAANNQQNVGGNGGGGGGNGNGATVTNNATTSKKESKKEIDKDREQGGDYLVEILGRYLNVYGVGAIKFVDKQWNTQKAQDVHTVKFSYINFNSISAILGRIKIRFPNVENYVFRETNIICLGQLNAMADTQGLKSITIDPEGNHIVANNKNWRAYCIWRLNHWGLKSINGMEITEEEIVEAEKVYNGLSDLVLWSLPESLLNPLFARLRVDEMLQNSKITPKEWLMKQADESIRLVVGKEALQWKKSNTGQQEETVVRRKGKLMFGHMMENTINAVEKMQKLEFLWPNILLEMIRNTLIDYSQIDLYVRNLLNELNSNATCSSNNNSGSNLINNVLK